MLRAYLELARPMDIALGVSGVIASAFISAGQSIGDKWLSLATVCITVILYIAGGNSVNDYVDHLVDAVSHPERPVPSGRISRKGSLIFGMVCLATATASSFAIGDPVSVAIVIAACVLIFLYEMILKRIGLLGNVLISVLTGASIILGGAAMGNIEPCLIPSLMAATVCLAREIQKDVEDEDGDRSERNTLPMTVGVGTSSVISAVLYVIVILQSFVPFFLGIGPYYVTILIADAILFFSVVRYRSPSVSESASKFAILAALVAFVLGTF